MGSASILSLVVLVSGKNLVISDGINALTESTPMSNISTATPAQLAQLSSFVVQLRSNISQFAKMMNKLNALNTSWEATVSSTIGIPANLPVTDSSGLAGVTQLTDTEVAGMMTSLQSLLGTYYTPAAQQTMVLWCGPTNMV